MRRSHWWVGWSAFSARRCLRISSTLPSGSPVRQLLAKFQAPLAERFGGHDCAADEQQFFHLPMAAIAVELQPGGAAWLMLSPVNRTPPRLHQLIAVVNARQKCPGMITDRNYKSYD